MSDRQVADAMHRIVLRHRRVGSGPVGDGEKLAADLGYDSMAFLMLISDLESEFALEVPLERIDELQDLSVGRLIELVRVEMEKR